MRLPPMMMARVNLRLVRGVFGMTAACNYDETALDADESCIFPEFGYDCDGNCFADEDGDGVCDPFEISVARTWRRN